MLLLAALPGCLRTTQTFADLKPENVLLKNDTASPIGVVAKVTDFGLSATLNPGDTHLSNMANGTPFYSAPEVVSAGKVRRGAPRCCAASHQPAQTGPAQEAARSATVLEAQLKGWVGTTTWPFITAMLRCARVCGAGHARQRRLQLRSAHVVSVRPQASWHRHPSP